MLKYNNKLNDRAKLMRKNMTREEKYLWHEFLKQYPVKFYRQKILGNYIVDFYCYKAEIIVEIDGKHHFEEFNFEYDNIRAQYFKSMEIKTMRFTNEQILNNPQHVFNLIDNEVKSRINQPHIMHSTKT